MNAVLGIATLLAVLALPAQADWRAALDGGKPVGQATLRWFGLRIYDAKLWSATGRYDPDAPFALEITYRKSIRAEQLVNTSLEEFRRIGAPAAQFERWRGYMLRAFPDVTDGDRLIGLFVPGVGARFYAALAGQPERLQARIDDPDFARWFFGIWLHPATREPALRQHLIGQTR